MFIPKRRTKSRKTTKGEKQYSNRDECLDGVDFIAMVNEFIDNKTLKDTDFFNIVSNVRCRLVSRILFEK